ncbi:conserved hypothetical protein [Brochothrix thermosphacta]|nr:conserved hypothetical protein [Brochothrix thermosphacta]
MGADIVRIYSLYESSMGADIVRIYELTKTVWDGNCDSN